MFVLHTYTYILYICMYMYFIKYQSESVQLLQREYIKCESYAIRKISFLFKFKYRQMAKRGCAKNFVFPKSTPSQGQLVEAISEISLPSTLSIPTFPAVDIFVNQKSYAETTDNFLLFFPPQPLPSPLTFPILHLSLTVRRA